jgi:AraC-like DNA-binding protein
MIKSEVGEPRGVLHQVTDGERFHHSRRLPAPDLRFFIAHYWIVAWDLRGREPERAETLPHPSIHLVLEKENSRIVGVMRGKFSRILKEQGRVFGIKFKPGAFYPFVKTPVSQYTNRILNLRDVFGVESEALEESILQLEDEERMIELADNFIRERLPERDENVSSINRIVDCVVGDREIIKVDDIVSRFGISKRTLQRLFSQYVGVSPKWMIKRYRLHEAMEQLASGDVADWPKMALELGYFDQAHFIKDFKTIVGKSPAEYAKDIRWMKSI